MLMSHLYQMIDRIKKAYEKRFEMEDLDLSKNFQELVDKVDRDSYGNYRFFLDL